MMTIEGYAAEVCRNVRAEAARAGIRQADLARALGMTTPKVNRRYRGQIPWQLDELPRVAATIGVPLEQLLQREGVARLEGFEPPTFCLGVGETLATVTELAA